MLQNGLAFIIYLFLFCWLIYKNQFFSLFKDETIKPKTYAFLFTIKALAVPVFYFVYKKLYGGIDNLDSGKFYHDAKVIHDFALKDFNFYLRLMFGFQHDLSGSYDFEYCLKNTLNWDNGTVKDYLYNDNRIIIRLHSLIEFISFGSYFVHALFDCLLSFIGIQFLYKCFKSYFIGKELWLLVILCFVPAQWFYTGALLKEGITIFSLGSSIYFLKKLIVVRKMNHFFFVIPIFLLCCLLKPYLLLFSIICFGLFFWIEHSNLIKSKVLLFFGIIFSVILMANLISVSWKSRSLIEAAFNHQRLFSGVAKGGIFLENEKHFVRLENDSTKIKCINKQLKIYSIKKNVAFMFWENGKSSDTLNCKSNQDTITKYRLAYIIHPSNSNISETIYSGSVIKMVLSSVYFSLFYPLFFNAKGLFQILASFENLMLVISLLFVCVQLFTSKQKHFFPLILIFVCISICLLVGIATPNSGAIFRYRAPIVSFIFIAALYYFQSGKLNMLNKSKS